eukprot:PITA_04085
MKDVPIYAKTIRGYCFKKPGRKPKDSLIIHVMGKISYIMLGKSIPVKYGDPGNLILTGKINGVDIPNVLVDLGATINVITFATVITLDLRILKPTPTVLELADRSTIRLVGKLEDITISIDSWQYLVDRLVLHTQSPASGHPLVLGRPWLATANSYIGCRSGNMSLPIKELESENEEVRPILTISEALCFKDETKDDAFSTFLSNPDSVSNSTHQLLEIVMSCNV